MRYLVALAVFALAVQGCFNTAPPQTAEPTYAGPDEYAAYGYADDPSFGFYDPLLYAYYWPLPYDYYYYPHARGDGDRDCDDGYCGPHGGGRPPYQRPLTVGSLPERLPSGVEAGSASSTIAATHVSSVGDSPVAAAPSDGFHGGGFGGDGFGDGGFHGDGFGGGGFGGGFHGGGFGGGGHR